jgi:hypothetical protein
MEHAKGKDKVKLYLYLNKCHTMGEWRYGST